MRQKSTEIDSPQDHPSQTGQKGKRKRFNFEGKGGRKGRSYPPKPEVSTALCLG